MSRKSIKERSPERKIMTGIGLALMTLAVLGVVQYRTLQPLVKADRRVAHTMRSLQSGKGHTRLYNKPNLALWG